MSSLNFSLLSTNLGLMIYGLASILFLQRLQRPRPVPALQHAALAALILATILLTFAAGRLVLDAPWPQVSTLALLALLGWLTVLAHWRFGLRQLGAFVAPLSTLVLLVHLFSASSGGIPFTAESRAARIFAGFHIFWALLGEVFAIFAWAVAILYLVQQKRLKHKQLDRLADDSPSLTKLERILANCLWAGFIFLTIGLLTGAVYTQIFVTASSLKLELKIVWGIAVWLWYFVTLLVRNFYQVSMRRQAQMAVVGFLLLSLSLFGVAFFSVFGGEGIQ